MGFAVLLEGLQAFTPDRHCDLQAAFYGVGGALVAALLADLFHSSTEAAVAEWADAFDAAAS